MARETRAAARRTKHPAAAGRSQPPSSTKPFSASSPNYHDVPDLPTPSSIVQPAEPTTVDHDDLCPICHLLLYRPVRTTCGHALCNSCMARWADVSSTSAGQMAVVPLTDDFPPPDEADAGQLEARCPLCRTVTRAVRDMRTEKVLRERYLQRWEEREKEELAEGAEGADGGEVKAMTVFVGNGHKMLEGRTGNCHEWTFFVRPGDVEVVEEVQILLHPTFRPPRIIRAMPPYQITRIGWGYFTIQAYIILKAGYTWVSEDAQRSSDGVEKGMLPLEWMLNFDGDGSMARCRLKYKHEIAAEESDSSYDDDSEYE